MSSEGDYIGWAQPLNARKAHFFVGGRSLCSRWLYLGEMMLTGGEGEEPRADDCRLCWKKARERQQGGSDV